MLELALFRPRANSLTNYCRCVARVLPDTWLLCIQCRLIRAIAKIAMPNETGCDFLNERNYSFQKRDRFQKISRRKTIIHFVAPVPGHSCVFFLIVET
jgi:hypothetical protein